MTHQTSITWLKTSSFLFIILGALFSWTTTGPLMVANLAFVDLIVWPLDQAQTYDAAETRVAVAIAGGLTAGFGMQFYMITRFVYEENPALGGKMILASIFTWYFVDGVGSVLAGSTFNVLANVSFLIMIALPVLLARPAESDRKLQA